MRQLLIRRCESLFRLVKRRRVDWFVRFPLRLIQIDRQNFDLLPQRLDFFLRPGQFARVNRGGLR